MHINEKLVKEIQDTIEKECNRFQKNHPKNLTIDQRNHNLSKNINNDR